MEFSHWQSLCQPIWLHSLCTNEQMISTLGREAALQVNSLASRWSLYENQQKVTFLRACTPHAKVHSLGREAWLDFRLHSFPWPDILRHYRLYKMASLTGHCGSYDHLLLEPSDEGEGETRIGRVTMMVAPRSRHTQRQNGSSKGKYY